MGSLGQPCSNHPALSNTIKEVMPMPFIQKGLNEDDVLAMVRAHLQEEGLPAEPAHDGICDLVVDDRIAGKIGVVAVGYVSEHPARIRAYHAAAQCIENTLIVSVRFNKHGNALVEVDTSDHILDCSCDPGYDAANPLPKLSEDPQAFAHGFIMLQVEHILRSMHFKTIEESPAPGFDLFAQKGPEDPGHLIRVVIRDDPADDAPVTEAIRETPNVADALLFEFILHADGTTSWALNPLSSHGRASG